jgi:hypothetical protein
MLQSGTSPRSAQLKGGHRTEALGLRVAFPPVTVAAEFTTTETTQPFASVQISFVIG